MPPWTASLPRADPRLPARQPDPDRQARHRPRLRPEGRRQGRAEAASSPRWRATGRSRSAAAASARRARCRRSWCSRVTGADARRRPLGRARRVGGATGPRAAHPRPHPPRRPRPRRRRPPARPAARRSTEPDAPLAARVIRRIGMGPRRVIGIYHEGEAGGRIAAIDKRDRPRLAGRARRPRRRPRGRARRGRGDRPGPRLRPAARAHRRPPRRPLGAAVGLADRHPRARHPRRVPRGRPRRGRRRAAGRRSASARTCARSPSSPSTPPTPATTTTPSSPSPTTTRRTRAATSSGWRSPTSPHYVRPGSALDREARRRGNSTYFPDRVVPMLPERLSADLCSLVDGADRPCIAVRLVLDADGHKRDHRFARAPDALGRHPHLRPGPGRRRRPPGRRRRRPSSTTVIRPLWAAWRAARTGPRRCASR